MTTPVATDYPDWGRYLAQANKVYVQQVAVLIAAPTILPAIFVGDQTHLAINYSTITNNATIGIDYYNNASLGQVIAQQTFSVAPGVPLGQSVPVLGAWALVTVSPVGGNATINLFISSAAGPSLNLRPGENANVLVSLDAPNIGAGATINTNMTQVWPGEVYWGIWSNAGLWAARLQSVTAAGGVTTLDYQDNTYQKSSRGVFLPYCPCRVQVTNFDGVLRQYLVTVTARPLNVGG